MSEEEEWAIKKTKVYIKKDNNRDDRIKYTNISHFVAHCKSTVMPKHDKKRLRKRNTFVFSI